MNCTSQAVHTHSPFGQYIIPAVIRFLALWWQTYMIWRNRQLAVAALQQLPCRLEVDAGIGCSGIEFVIRTERPGRALK